MLLKKIAALASAAAIAFGTLCFPASAASPDEDFVISNNILTDYTGNGGDIVIPEGVIKIDGLAFQKNDKITSLVIPKGCTKIEVSAFYNCTALKTVTFEGDMEAVGLMSFCGCTALERVTFKGNVIDADPNDVESGLSYNAFMGCKNLKTVEFEPNSRVDTIKRAAFMDCAKLSEVKLPKEVGKICEFAFTNCPKLTRLEIPSKTELEEFAVGYMYDETTEKSVKADGIATVQACLDFDDDEFTQEEVCQKPITLVVTPNSPADKYVKENGIDYEYRAFDEEGDFIIETIGTQKHIIGYNGKGGDIVIPEGITAIGADAFDENDTITSLVIPKGCIWINAGAFTYCTSLRTVTFEGDIEMIGELSFYACTALEKVTFKGNVIDNAPDNSGDGIGYNAFMGCKNLKTVEFEPNSRVDTIKRAAFMDCANLSEVKLPNEVGKICKFAFTNCPKLTRLEIPSMTELEPLAVGYMYDETTDESVKADGKATVQACLDFDDDEFTQEEVCQKPITLVVTPNSPAEKYAEENGIAYEYIAFDDESDFIIETFGTQKRITGYNGKGGDIVIPEGVTEIDDLAFQKNDKITSLVVPKGCTKIETLAFCDCTALKTVTFEGDMEAVGMFSFSGCTALERVTFKGSVIGGHSKDWDSGLSYNAFMGCKNLKTVEFAPNSRVDIIKRAAFMDCANLSEVKLPNEVGKICEFAFTNCPQLTRLEIPSMTELEPLAVGYMYDEPTEKSVKADGIATVQACLDFDDDEFTQEEVCQKPITLVVSPDSPAEKYAVENGIAYEYKAAPAPDNGSTQSPKTGGESALPLLAAMALSLTAMIFTRAKKV